MTFVYPADVGNVLAKRWHSLQSRLSTPLRSKGKDTALPTPQPPFPTEDNLRLILDTVYHASFLVEEGRQLCIRVLYLPPGACEGNRNQVANLHAQPFKFTPACPLTVSELLRLVPALDPFQSVLVVCADSDLPQPTGSAPVVIWGVLRLGLEWWRVVTGRESGAVAPPNCLTITSPASGRLTATTLGMVLVRLEGGRILAMPLEHIGDGAVGEFLRPAAEQLYTDVVKKLKIRRYDRSSDSDQHPRQQYFRVLSNIVNIAKEKRHGATFVLFPDTISPRDQRLADRIHLKYVIDGVSIWEQLIEESIANREYYKHLFPKKHVFLTQQDDAKPDKLKQLIRWEERHEHAEEDIREFENFVASLSGIDGCVVLTTTLRVLGFGGEILAQSPSLAQIKVAHDPYGNQTSDQSITSFGTRHRSAFRVCSSFENCIAFVVSQDGGVKAIMRVGPDVVIWPDVNMGRFDL
jgi:hypothetical protein